MAEQVIDTEIDRKDHQSELWRLIGNARKKEDSTGELEKSYITKFSKSWINAWEGIRNQFTLEEILHDPLRIRNFELLYKDYVNLSKRNRSLDITTPSIYAFLIEWFNRREEGDGKACFLSGLVFQKYFSEGGGLDSNLRLANIALGTIQVIRVSGSKIIEFVSYLNEEAIPHIYAMTQLDEASVLWRFLHIDAYLSASSSPGRYSIVDEDRILLGKEIFLDAFRWVPASVQAAMEEQKLIVVQENSVLISSAATNSKNPKEDIIDSFLQTHSGTRGFKTRRTVLPHAIQEVVELTSNCNAARAKILEHQFLKKVLRQMCLMDSCLNLSQA